MLKKNKGAKEMTAKKIEEKSRIFIEQ